MDLRVFSVSKESSEMNLYTSGIPIFFQNPLNKSFPSATSSEITKQDYISLVTNRAEDYTT